MASAVDPAPSDDPALFPEVEWDFTSGYPLPHLNFLLDRLMPEWNLQPDQKSQQTVQDHVDRLCSNQQELQPVLIGSFTENLCLPPAYRYRDGRLSEPWQQSPDVDILAVLQEFSVGRKDQHKTQNQCWVYNSSPENNPGSFNLTPVNLQECYDMTMEKDGNIFLSPGKLWEKYRIDLPKDSHDLTLFIQGAKDKFREHNLRFSDPFLALPCPEWPLELRAWKSGSRSTNWPPEKVLEEIFQDGCHVVPATHWSQSGSDLQWSFSFTTAEQKLAQCLSLQQRQCYLLLKLLVEEVLTPPRILTAYHIKNHLFWCLEKIPVQQWEDPDSRLASPFLCLLDELMYALIEGCLPQYFNPENNLFSHIPGEFLQDLMGKVSSLRKNPIFFFKRIDGYRKFRHSTVYRSLKEIQQPIEDNIQTYHDNLDECYQIHWAILHDLCGAYLQDEQYEGAYDCCLKICEMQPGQIEQPLQLKILTLEAMKDVCAYEYSLEKHSNIHIPAFMLGNLACMYTSLYSSESQASQIEEYKSKADQTFQKALEAKENEAALIVDYAVFKRKCGEITEIIPLLEESTNQPGDGNMVNTYGAQERCSLDSNLRELLTDAETLTAPAIIFTFYHLIQCYLTNDQKTKAVEVIPRFETECEMNKTAAAYLLLGCCYRDLQNYKAAKESFSKVYVLEPGYLSAERNKTFCETKLQEGDRK